MQKSINRSHVITSVVAAVLLAAFAFSTPFAAHAAKDTMKTKKTVDSSCMQTAVNTRETAIASTFVEFNTSILTALTLRKTALNAAWGMTEMSDQKTALKKAWMDWKTAKKAASMKLKTDRKATWDTFKTTAKTSCKMETPKEESLEKDSAGNISL